VRPLKTSEKTKNNPDPKNYPIPHTSGKNQKQKQVSQVKDKGKPKNQIQFPNGVANLLAG